MSSTPAEMIAEKGADTIAARLGVELGTVRVWKHRNRFPRTIWPELVTAFPELTLDQLRSMEASAEAAA